MKLTPEQLKTIDATIKSIAKAQADRFFKSERNTLERAVLVYAAIGVQVGIALLDAGVSLEQLVDIDPSDEIKAAMGAAGFGVEGIAVENADLRDVFGPVERDCA